jgi:hypothetical protein
MNKKEQLKAIHNDFLILFEELKRHIDIRRIDSAYIPDMIPRKTINELGDLSESILTRLSDFSLSDSAKNFCQQKNTVIRKSVFESLVDPKS